MFHRGYIETIKSYVATTAQEPRVKEDIISPESGAMRRKAASGQEGQGQLDSVFNKSTLQWSIILVLFLTSFGHQLLMMKELQRMSDTISTLETMFDNQVHFGQT
jgi:hypothetical protein